MALIYVVEDSRVTRHQVTAALARTGEEVRDFADAEAALAAVADRSPDLLITDVLLPGISGIELCRRLRQHHGRLELPVIVVSSLDRLEDVARAYEAGADDYLVKPVDLEELALKARTLLGRRAQATGEGAGWTRYELLEPLGTGRTAATHRARRRSDGSELALKVVEQSAGPDAVARLLAEAELLRSLEDVPGIVRVRDIGSEAGATYYAMDLVPGETLRTRLERDRRLPSPEVATLGRSLATTLAALTSADVVHGDVKPENILLGPEGAVLIDFGLAHRVGHPDPGRGGTLTYLAPEVLRGGERTAASDVYALGVVLFESLTGALPYAGSGADIAARKVEGAAPDLEPLLGLDVAPGLIAIVESTLEPHPGRRAARASEIAVGILPYSQTVAGA